jgi:Aminotransferase class-V
MTVHASRSRFLTLPRPGPRRFPLRWVREVQSMSTPSHEWKVLLDAAAFVPTQPLDLSVTPADFVTVSFYKMFGFPTGLGALLVRPPSAFLLYQLQSWCCPTACSSSDGVSFVSAFVLLLSPSPALRDASQCSRC